MGEYEPEDSRNVTGTATTPDGRWTNKEGKPPVGVPDDKPVAAKEAEAQRKDREPGIQPPAAGDPNLANRDGLPGTRRPANES